MIIHRNRKANSRAFRAADPVNLSGFDLFNEFGLSEAGNKSVCILRNSHYPLTDPAACDLGPAALTVPIDHFLIRQTHFTGGAPINGHLSLVSQSLFEELDENPLGPLVIVGIGCIYDPTPIKGEAQSIHLRAVVLCVCFCDILGFLSSTNGVVFRWQAERVPSDGEHHVPALHSLKARIYISPGIREGMSNM